MAQKPERIIFELKKLYTFVSLNMFKHTFDCLNLFWDEVPPSEVTFGSSVNISLLLTAKFKATIFTLMVNRMLNCF